MIDDVYILDDFLPPKYVDQIETIFLGQDINWKLLKDVTHNIDMARISAVEKAIPACGVTFYDDRFGGALDPIIFFSTLPMIHSGMQKIGYSADYRPFRMRSFLQFPLAKDDQDEYNNPHVDDCRPHIAFLYYVNDSDGDTVLFNQTFDDIPYDQYPTSEFVKELPTKLSIYKRVSPKRGRALIFNGNKYHASSTPSKNVRCIINADLMNS